jgi:hypothetical protein
MRAKIAGALFAMVALPAAAQTAETPRVDARQDKQEARIEQGAKSGELTQKEIAKLEAGQARVEAKETKAKADGKVTKKERTRLAHSQNKQSKRIHHQKHDKQKQAPAT